MESYFLVIQFAIQMVHWIANQSVQSLLRKVSGDGICDETCTAKECDYDGGDCPWAQ